MRKHSFLRGLTAFALAGLLAFYSGVVQLPNVSAESITDLKSQLAKLEKQEEENNKRLEELRDDVSQKRAYRDELQGKIDIIQQQLDILVQRINELDAQIEQGEQDIADTRISINANYTKLKKRLRALYMAGEASNLSILLSSTSLVDYTQKSEVIQSVTKHDTELLDTLEEQLTSIQEQVEKINADKEELSTDKKDLDSKSDELSALYLENQKLLDEAEQNEAEAQAEAERLEKEKEEADAAIDKWYEDYYAALKAASTNSGGSYDSGVGYIGTGSFVWPMPGYTYITCYYGDGGHRGIDIAGGGIYGKPIVAADGGKVIYSAWMDSYGYCVFIDHGNGYSTRYAHASALACSVGDTVSPGQTIAYVGSTGNSTGPHLHFEVIYYGSTTNPFNYF